MNANTCTFTPDTMTINGIEFPAGYSIPPHGDGSVFVFVQQGEQRIRIRITPDDPHHAAALAAARPDPDRPTDKPTEQPAALAEALSYIEVACRDEDNGDAVLAKLDKLYATMQSICSDMSYDGTVYDDVTNQIDRIRRSASPYSRHFLDLAMCSMMHAETTRLRNLLSNLPEERPDSISDSHEINGEERRKNILNFAADPAPAQEEQPANPDKQAHGPVPEKTWIGTSIQGNGWKIEFCPIFERTRLIFDRIPTKEARELVKAAGFAWSPKMGSWNKRLTWKAYRAAQQLAADLANLTRRAC